MKNVAVLLGSLRKDSINRNLAGALQKLGEGRLAFDYLPVGELPLYNDDLWENAPEVVLDLKRRVQAADAVLIVTPEYNRSFPGTVKNALDWASRPYGQNSWNGKPLALTGASPGGIGTAVAQSQLRSILPVYGFIVMGQPDVYFQYTVGIVDEHFNITDDQARDFLATFIDKYVAWIDRHGS